MKTESNESIAAALWGIVIMLALILCVGLYYLDKSSITSQKCVCCELDAAAGKIPQGESHD